MEVGNSYFYYTDLQIKIKKNLIVKSSTPAGHRHMLLLLFMMSERYLFVMRIGKNGD